MFLHRNINCGYMYMLAVLCQAEPLVFRLYNFCSDTILSRPSNHKFGNCFLFFFWVFIGGLKGKCLLVDNFCSAFWKGSGIGSGCIDGCFQLFSQCNLCFALKLPATKY